MPMDKASFSPSEVSSFLPTTLPNNPVSTVRTAVSSGNPPRWREISSAIGELTDFGSMLSRISRLPPRRPTRAAALTMPISDPMVTAIRMPLICFLIIAAFLYSGTPRATVAGPSNRVIISAPTL
ncbi:hypothetical protein D3C86_1654940 [compost metagenome]